MAVSLIKLNIGFSVLKQSLQEYAMIKNKQVTNVLQTFFGKCNHRRYYHATSTLYNKHSSKPQKPAVVEKSHYKSLPVINVWQGMSVAEFAKSTHVDLARTIEALSMVTYNERFYPNTVLNKVDLMRAAAKLLGKRITTVNKEDKEKIEVAQQHDVTKRPRPDQDVLVKRRPVVTIMGHVDHGKTTLLDALRNTSVVKTEFGGITQHIGAFNVILKTGESLTFLDTPGHAAFSAMRARGAQVTDIVVLVVAADDGVMDQTVESIAMAKDANVPIIVAINKIDKPEADIERTCNMLSQHGILVESLGGTVQSVNISALKSTNLQTLVESIILQAEIMDLKGDPTGLVEGVVIECTNNIGRGKLATILVQRGTLKKGAVLVCGTAFAKVRSMFDHAGNVVLKAGLSDAVQIIGWDGMPTIGEEILEVEHDRKAHMIVKYRKAQQGKVLAEKHAEGAQEKLEKHLIEYNIKREQRKALSKYAKLCEPRVKESEPESNVPKVNIIIKGDVAGSVEAILDIFGTYQEDQKCQLNIVHYGVGTVTKSDIELAKTFDAIIYGFNIRVPNVIQNELEDSNVSIRTHKVIYKLVDDVKRVINNKLPVHMVEEIIGEANVLQEFEITERRKKIKVAGCRCVKGSLKKNALYRVVRGQEEIFNGKLVSMKHVKNEVTTIKTDTECGLRFQDSTVSFCPGDTVICFIMKESRQETTWNPGF